MHFQILLRHVPRGKVREDMATGGTNLAPSSLRERAAAYLYPQQRHTEEHALRKKPSNLLYDVDENPPLIVRLGLAIQHIFMMSIGWLYVSVICGAVGASQVQTEAMIRMSMLAGGLGTILQASRTVFGSGYLCPLSGSLTYLQPSIAAASSGGFPLLFGMVSVSGVVSSLMSRVMAKLRVLFPPEVTGLMISMSGLQLVAIGCPRFVGQMRPGEAPQIGPVIVGVLTLLAMLSATVWPRGKLHAMPMLVGIVVGFGAALALGVLPWAEFVHGFDEPWLSLPRRVPGGLLFRWSLLIPFLIASLTANLKAVGDLTLCQKINDEDWKRTDMNSVSGGLFANAAGTLLSGVFGGVAQNTVSSSVGLALATGATSRSIALPTGLLVIALAFLPKISAMLAAMPTPVMGAMLVYAACFIILGGVQLLTSRMLDARRIFVVGISLIFGLSVEISPEIYRHVPVALHPIFSSSTSLATVLVVLLGMVLRMGVAKQQSIVIRAGRESFEPVHRFMEEQGSAWGMRREIEIRAEQAIHEALACIAAVNPFLREVEITAEFDELNLKVALEYSGVAPLLAGAAPTVEQLATDEGIAALSGFMIRQYADDVSIRMRGEKTRVQLGFEH